MCATRSEDFWQVTFYFTIITQFLYRLSYISWTLVGMHCGLLNFWSIQITFVEKFEFLHIFVRLLGDNKKLRKYKPKVCKVKFKMNWAYMHSTRIQSDQKLFATFCSGPQFLVQNNKIRFDPPFPFPSLTNEEFLTPLKFD